LYVMTAEFGAPTQLEKIDMIDYADFIAINKFEQKGAEDALIQVRKQYERSRLLFHENAEDFPIFGTSANQFNDPGVNQLFIALMDYIQTNYDGSTPSVGSLNEVSNRTAIIPNDRIHYLREISNTVREYHKDVEKQRSIASSLYQLSGSLKIIEDEQVKEAIQQQIEQEETRLSVDGKTLLENWSSLKEIYAQDTYAFQVRGKEIEVPLTTTSLSGVRIPKVKLPSYTDWGDRLNWLMKENVPGAFPYTAGVFPLKRQGEDPTRQFAGEGTPERTNRRFHYLSADESAKRLSTAFDSVTLYGEDPSEAPDVYGKVGESGVSVCTLDNMKQLYEGFDLIHESTSVSMTINGPAPIILAMYFHTAIDQQVEKFVERENRTPTDEEYKGIKNHTLSIVRGTVQADILKEDQGQNT